MKGNIIQMNTLHLNSVRLNGIGKVQSVSLKGGSTEDPVFPPVEPPIEPEPTPTYTLSASVTNGMVSAKRNGSAVNLPFTANEGDTIVVSVTPNDGYAFEGWADGNTDNPRSITMNADVALSAQCVEVVQPSKYIQFEDAEVERVLMSKGVSSDGVGITIEDAEKVTDISSWFRGNTTIQSFNEFKYFTGVTTLVSENFNNCKKLKHITFPNSLVEIGNYVFINCTSLEGEISLPCVTKIGASAFNRTLITSLDAPLLSQIGSGGISSNKGLKVVKIPSCITLGGEAFNGCSALEYVDIGAVEEIKSYTFWNTAIQVLIVRNATPPTLASNVFSTMNGFIYVPDASLEAYKTAVNWSAYADRIHPLSEIEGSLVFYDKLVGDGFAYINTEYYPKGLDSFAWDAEPPRYYNKFIFGVKSPSIRLGALSSNASQTYYLYGAVSAKSVAEDNTSRVIRQMVVYLNEEEKYRRILKENGEEKATFGYVGQYEDAIASQPLLLFSCQTNETSATPDRIYGGAIRGFSISDIDGNTIMSLKPCTWNGEAGMWDEVNGKFYGNAATSGEFSVAND